MLICHGLCIQCSTNFKISNDVSNVIEAHCYSPIFKISLACQPFLALLCNRGWKEILFRLYCATTPGTAGTNKKLWRLTSTLEVLHGIMFYVPREEEGLVGQTVWLYVCGVFLCMHLALCMLTLSIPHQPTVLHTTHHNMHNTAHVHVLIEQCFNCILEHGSQRTSTSVLHMCVSPWI